MQARLEQRAQPVGSGPLVRHQRTGPERRRENPAAVPLEVLEVRGPLHEVGGRRKRRAPQQACRDDDGRDAGMLRSDVHQEVQPTATWQIHVGEDQIELLIFDDLARCVEVDPGAWSRRPALMNTIRQTVFSIDLAGAPPPAVSPGW